MHPGIEKIRPFSCGERQRWGIHSDTSLVLLHGFSPAGAAHRIIDCGRNVHESLRLRRCDARRIAVKGDRLQAAAAPERTCANAGQAGREGDAAQARALVEHLGSNCDQILRKGDAGQAAAVTERTFTNAGHPLWEGDVGQLPAVMERPFANAGQAVREGDAGQVPALLECRASNAGQPLREGSAGHFIQGAERAIANAGHAFFHYHGRDLATVVAPELVVDFLHRAGAGDGQGVIIRYNPGHIAAARALCQHAIRRKRRRWQQPRYKTNCKQQTLQSFFHHFSSLPSVHPVRIIVDLFFSRIQNTVKATPTAKAAMPMTTYAPAPLRSSTAP